MADTKYMSTVLRRRTSRRTYTALLTSTAGADSGSDDGWMDQLGDDTICVAADDDSASDSDYASANVMLDYDLAPA